MAVQVQGLGWRSALDPHCGGRPARNAAYQVSPFVISGIALPTSHPPCRSYAGCDRSTRPNAAIIRCSNASIGISDARISLSVAKMGPRSFVDYDPTRFRGVTGSTLGYRPSAKELGIRVLPWGRTGWWPTLYLIRRLAVSCLLHSSSSFNFVNHLDVRPADIVAWSLLTLASPLPPYNTIQLNSCLFRTPLPLSSEVDA